MIWMWLRFEMIELVSRLYDIECWMVKDNNAFTLYLVSLIPFYMVTAKYISDQIREADLNRRKQYKLFE